MQKLKRILKSKRVIASLTALIAAILAAVFDVQIPIHLQDIFNAVLFAMVGEG